MSTTPEVCTTPDVVRPVADVYWRPGCPYCSASGAARVNHARPLTPTEGEFPLTRSPTAPRMGPAIGTAGAVLAADAVSKAWAMQQVSSESAASTAIVQLRHVANSGASFGLGAQHPLVVVVVAAIATVSVGWWLTKVDSAGERLAVAVVLGGALGNLIDRLANGAVTDWVGISWYPATFNLADVAIRGGVVVALVVRQVHHLRTRPAGAALT